MKFGIYIHIPFCLQLCPYCDFSTISNDESEHEDYVNLILKEIKNRSHLIPYKDINTIYFGGGTPSLLSPRLISQILKQLAAYDFNILPDCEITLEINPGTVNQNKLNELLSIGVNRFSLGSQTFNDELLNTIGRKHNVKETLDCLELFAINNLNFSTDLLFALPNQSLEQLNIDINTLLQFKPKHISPYYLTLPQSHRLNHNRPSEELELEMFNLIEEKLSHFQYERYEISNYSLPNFKSMHNWNAWRGNSYWGIGMSSHSYLSNDHFGLRFWNPVAKTKWISQLDQIADSIDKVLTPNQLENLSELESLSDFCHTSLRTHKGIIWSELNSKYSNNSIYLVKSALSQAREEALIDEDDEGFKLSKKGKLLSNRAFYLFHFS